MDDTNGRLTLTCTNLSDGSTFKFTKIIYSDGEASPQTYSLNGGYIFAGGPTGNFEADAGKYWITENEVTISLTDLDSQGIITLVGYAGLSAAGTSAFNDKVSAEAGWNMKYGTLSASAVTGQTVTFVE